MLRRSTGTVFGALVLCTARNPSLKDELFRIAILGFALTEAIALFALMMAFLILFVNVRGVKKKNEMCSDFSQPEKYRHPSIPKQKTNTSQEN